MKKWLCGLSIAAILMASPMTVFAEETGNDTTGISAAQALSVSDDMNTEQPATGGQTEEAPPAPVIYVTTVNLNLRVSPTTESTRLGTFERGTSVTVIDFLDGEWFLVEVGGLTGYMKTEFLALPGQVVPEQAKSDTQAKSAVTGIGVVELLTWSEAKSIFTIGTPAQIIDVRTRNTYWVASFSNGNHADVEPITADDTAAMKKTYGGSWSWDPRPILVIINGRTLAASINGMPHGGGVNDNNNMNGQVCIHFKNSKTHNGNKSHERDHQSAISEAYNSALTW